VILQEVKDLDLSQLALGVFAAALGEADVAAELDELRCCWGCCRAWFGLATTLGSGGTSAAAN
jgi:hypothetical protein